MKLNIFLKATGKQILVAIFWGVLVSSASLFITWQSIGVVRPLPISQRRTLGSMCFIDKAIQCYQEEHGAMPVSLDHIAGNLPFPIVTEDWWGNPFVYIVNGTNWTLSSYGRDSQPGGLGYDSDLSLQMPSLRTARPTFLQFVTTRSVVSDIVFMWIITTLAIGYIILRVYTNNKCVKTFFIEVVFVVGVGIIISCGFMFIRVAVIHF